MARPFVRLALIAAVVAPTLGASCFGGDGGGPTGPGGTGSNHIVLAFCPGDMPLFMAYQNDGGAWTPVTASGGSFTFDATNRFAVTFVSQEGTNFHVTHAFLTASEAAPINGTACLQHAGTINATGSVAGLATTQQAQIMAAGAFGYADSTTPGYSLSGLPNRPVDLVAARLNSTTYVADKLIVRHSQTIASNAVIPTLNFAAAEAIAPSTATFTVNNAGSDALYAYSSFRTALDTWASLGSDAAGTSAAVVGVPTSAQVAGDINETEIYAYPTSGNGSRYAISYQKALAARTVTLGPAAPTPTVTNVSTTPARKRVQLARTSEYGTAAIVGLDQSTAGRSVALIITAGYAGSGSTWDVTMPDLSGVAGWQATWGLSSTDTTDWFVDVFGGSSAEIFGVPATDGALVVGAYNTNSAPIVASANRLPGGQRERPARSRLPIAR